MNIADFATLIHTKKLIHCVAISTILYGDYYPPHGEFKLICIEKFARRTWVNFTQQYGKNRQRCQQNKFYYAVWQLLLYFFREYPSRILSVWPSWMQIVLDNSRFWIIFSWLDNFWRHWLRIYNSKIINCGSNLRIRWKENGSNMQNANKN